MKYKIMLIKVIFVFLYILAISKAHSKECVPLSFDWILHQTNLNLSKTHQNPEFSFSTNWVWNIPLNKNGAYLEDSLKYWRENTSLELIEVYSLDLGPSNQNIIYGLPYIWIGTYDNLNYHMSPLIFTNQAVLLFNPLHKNWKKDTSNTNNLYIKEITYEEFFNKTIFLYKIEFPNKFVTFTIF